MEQANHMAHAVLGVIAAFATLVLAGMDYFELFVRMVMGTAGLTTDMQTLLLIIITTTALVAARRLMKGILRTLTTVMLLLVMAQIMSVLARHGAAGIYS